MATMEQVIALARQELGYREAPPYSNRTKYGKWYGLDAQPWCMMFIMWIFNEADALELLPVRTASCGEFMKSAQKTHNWHTKDFKPGDIAIFDFPGNGSMTDHVGLVVEVPDDASYVFTIEGNTSMSSDSDGGIVMRRKRKCSLILGAFRPAYEAEIEAEPENVIPDTPEEEDVTLEISEADHSPDDEIIPEVGDFVLFKGYSQFSGTYDDAEAVPAQTCMARIDIYCPGTAHPFRLYGKNIEGWADWDDVELIPAEQNRSGQTSEQMTQTLSLGASAFTVEITARPSLRVRSGPGISYECTDNLSTGTIVTIIEERDGWGRLSKGDWISLSYIRRK